MWSWCHYNYIVSMWLPQRLQYVYHESSVGLSSTTNPKPRGSHPCACTGTPRYYQQKAEPPNLKHMHIELLMSRGQQWNWSWSVEINRNQQKSASLHMELHWHSLNCTIKGVVCTATPTKYLKSRWKSRNQLKSHTPLLAVADPLVNVELDILGA